MDDAEDMDQVAERTLEKVRAFAATLDESERSFFAALIAPAVAAAWSEEEVEGFGVSWSPTRIRDHLREAIRNQEFHIRTGPRE